MNGGGVLHVFPREGRPRIARSILLAALTWKSGQTLYLACMRQSTGLWKISTIFHVKADSDLVDMQRRRGVPQFSSSSEFHDEVDVALSAVFAASCSIFRPPSIWNESLVPLSNNLATLMFVVASDPSEAQRETHKFPSSSGNECPCLHL